MDCVMLFLFWYTVSCISSAHDLERPPALQPILQAILKILIYWATHQLVFLGEKIMCIHIKGMQDFDIHVLLAGLLWSCEGNKYETTILCIWCLSDYLPLSGMNYSQHLSF